MEKKMAKAILVMEDGAQEEYEGEGVVVCTVKIDKEKNKTIATGCAHGIFNLERIVGVYTMMAQIFDDKWEKAGFIHCLKHIQNKLAKDEDAGTDEEAPERPVE